MFIVIIQAQAGLRGVGEGASKSRDAAREREGSSRSSKGKSRGPCSNGVELHWSSMLRRIVCKKIGDVARAPGSYQVERGWRPISVSALGFSDRETRPSSGAGLGQSGARLV